VHQLIANHQQILSECVYRSFEVPLLHELDQWRRHIEEEEVTYQKEAKSMSRQIQRLEKEGLKLHKQRKRDVAKFRGHLVELTTKLDGLTTLHGGHARTLLRDSQETSTKIVEASSSLVRAEVDIFEALARKGWSGGGLEDLLERGKDLFAPNEADLSHSMNDNSKIFSILPQKSILAGVGDVSAGGGLDGVPQHKRSDSLLVDEERYQSLGAVVEGRGQEGDNRSIFSERNVPTEGILNRSRGVRPFSPPPMDRVAVEDPLESFPPPVALGHEESGDTVIKTPKEEERGGEEGEHAKSEVKEGDRGRERRWSVTDDGIVSD